MKKTNNYTNYYVGQKWKFNANDPIVKEAVRMLKNYFQASKQRVFVVKHYKNDGTVIIEAKAA